MSDTLHVFEQAGLGKAPYRYLGMEVLRGPITVSTHMGVTVQVGAPGQPMGSCQFCSTGIAYAFWLESADNKKFYVGSDCIHKSGDLGLRRAIEPELRRHEKELRDTRNAALIAQFEAYATSVPGSGGTVEGYFKLDTRPHPWPYRASRGETNGDFSWTCYRWSGPTKKAKFARAYLLEANQPLPDSKRRKKADRPKGWVPNVYEIPGKFGFIKIIDMGDE